MSERRGGYSHLFAAPTTEAGRKAGKLADEAIGLYLEFVQTHGYDEDAARAAAVAEIEEGHSVDTEAIEREMDAARDELSAPALEGLPL